MSLWGSFYRGDIDDLARRVPALRRDSTARGDLYAVTNLSTGFLPFLHLIAGQPEAARREAAEALERWSRQGFHLQHLNGALAKVQSELYEGDGARAYATISEQWDPMRKSMILTVQQIRVRATHLRACAALAADQLGRAERDAARLEGEKSPWASALALTIRAAVAARQDRRVQAADLYGRAAAELAACDMSLYAAGAQRRRGELLGGEAGAREIDLADRWMQGHHIKEPDRLTRMLAP
jgi:hypothetical protein